MTTSFLGKLPTQIFPPKPKKPVVEEPVVTPPRREGEYLTQELAEAQGFTFPEPLDPGWQLRVTRDPRIGTKTSLVSPEGWEFAPGRVLSPEGDVFTETEYLELLAEQQRQVEPIFEAALPEQDINTMLQEMVIREGATFEEIDVAIAAQDRFIDTMQEIGRTPQTENLLRQLGVEESDLPLFFAPPVPIEQQVEEFREEGWIKDNIIDPLYLGGVNFIQGIKQTVTGLLPAMLFKPVEVGELKAMRGGVPIYYTSEEVAAQNRMNQDVMRDAQARYLRYVEEEEAWIAKHPELTPRPEYEGNPFDNPALFLDPGFYAHTISSSIAYSLSVMGTIAGVTVATGGNVIAGIAAGMGVAGAPEASDMTKELMDMGIPFDEAVQWGFLYGGVAGGVESVTNLPLLGIFFKPLKQATKPFWDTLFKLTKNRILKASIVGGVLPTVEGMEEAVTQAAHNAIIQHYDETKSILEGMDEAFIKGVIASLPFAALGGTASYRSFRQALPPDTGVQLDTLIAGFVKAGATEEEAQVMAANEIAKTPEGESIIRKALDTVRKIHREEIGAIQFPEKVPTLSLDEISKLEVRIPLDLIRKDEPETLARLTEEIKKEGITEPITIRVREDGSMIVWDGIHRLIVAQNLGIKNVPVRFIGEKGEPLAPPAVVPPPIKPTPTPEVAVPRAEVPVAEVKPEVVEAPPPTIEEAVQKELVIQKAKQNNFVETTGENITKAGVDAFTAQSDVAGLPPPNIPPGVTGHIGSGGKNAENPLYDMANRVIPGEDAGRAALRLWDGTRNRMATETIAWWRKGNKSLKGLNVGKADGQNQRLTEEDSLELFKALHGEGKVPAKLQPVYDELKTFLDQEAADMLAFDPTFSRVLMAHPDYFPRGWRPPTEAMRLKLGAKPGFLKPRVDATFTEMVEAGWVPISWNPFDMAALRRMAGTEYREGQILISRLKTFNKAIAEHDAPREGWRVPKVGPAFEGKPYVGTDGKAYMTPKVSVPNNVADILESIYGVKIEFRVAGVDIWKGISTFGSVTKRAKLFMSLFQHVDFLTRDFIVAFTPEGIRHGLPLKFPALAARVSWSAVSPTSRANLEARILSGEPLYVDSDITLKMVADKGWKLGQDELLIRRDVREQLENIVREAQEEGLKVRWFQRAGQEIVKATDPVTRRLATVARFFEAGLFEGVYRESQAYALEHVIIPRLKRFHPDWTSEQIAGSAAEEVNKQYSTLAVWQSVLQQPAAREMARTFFFSWNESEAWIRQATSTVSGKNARYWREYQIATFIALAVAANVINMISEGEPLPPDRYVPFALGSPYSSMPWGLAYNDKFMSPRLPWNGRNGQPIYLDIVGQADTWMRWMLDPAGALTARVNVLPRAVINQVQGRDFWGRELKDWGDRVKQAVIDLFAPIGAGNLLEVARLQWPDVGFIPEAEGRIGIVGSLIQATGLNVRSIKTRDMLDKFARESGLKKDDGTPVESWDDLEPHQRRQLEKNEDLQIELGLRSVVAVERQYPGAEGFAKLDKIDQERIVRGEALVAELVSSLIGVDRTEAFETARGFRMEVTRLKKEVSDRKSQIDEDYQLFKDTGELPDDPNKRALVEYYNIFEKAKRPSGVMDWERVNELELALRDGWTPAQSAYVDRNIRLTEWGPLMQEFVDAQRTLSDSGYWDVSEIDRRVFRYEHDEIEDILTGKFYNYKPIEGEAEKLSLKWQDVYRQIEAMREKYKDMTDAQINYQPPIEGISAEDWDRMSPDRKRDTLIDFDKERIANENQGFWEDDRKKTAWNAVGDLLDEKRSLVFVSEFTEYSNIIREFSSNSVEAKLYRFDSKELDALGTEEEVFNWDDLKESEVPLWRLQVKWRDKESEYDAIDPDARNPKTNVRLRDEWLAQPENELYSKDRRKIEALQIDFPEDEIENYIDYYTNPDLVKPADWDDRLGWYEDDWWLQAHPSFHQALVDTGVWSELRDLSKVPTREVFDLYVIYRGLPSGQVRLDYRAKHSDLEWWLVRVKGYKPLSDRGDVTADISRQEKLARDIAENLEKLKELARTLP